MEKRKNTEPVLKNKKCGRMGNLFENVFGLEKYSKSKKYFWRINDLKQNIKQILDSITGSIINSKIREKIKNMIWMEVMG